MTSDELKNKLTKIALCDDGYKRVCLVNELEEELIKDLEIAEKLKETVENHWDIDDILYLIEEWIENEK